MKNFGDLNMGLRAETANPHACSRVCTVIVEDHSTGRTSLIVTVCKNAYDAFGSRSTVAVARTAH